MKILLIPKGFLGDTILATPLIANLVRHHPGVEIWVLTTAPAAQLLNRDPLLAGVIIFDRRGKDRGLGGLVRFSYRLRTMGFDWAYIIQRSYRAAMLAFFSRIPHRIGFADAPFSFLYTHAAKVEEGVHEVQRNLGLLAHILPDAELEPVLRLIPPTAIELDKELGRVIPRPGTYAVLVPGSTWPTKMWHWRRYRDVARYLIGRQIPVVLDGAPEHRELNDQVGRGLAVRNLAGRTNVADAMYLIRHAAVVVCNDSMALHMASAFKVPCVAVFCATSPENGFGPWQSPAVVVQNDTLTCRPCGRHGGRQCPTGSEACCRDVDADEVIRALQTLLAR